MLLGGREVNIGCKWVNDIFFMVCLQSFCQMFRLIRLQFYQTFLERWVTFSQDFLPYFHINPLYQQFLYSAIFYKCIIIFFFACRIQFFNVQKIVTFTVALTFQGISFGILPNFCIVDLKYPYINFQYRLSLYSPTSNSDRRLWTISYKSNQPLV